MDLLDEELEDFKKPSTYKVVVGALRLLFSFFLVFYSIKFIFNLPEYADYYSPSMSMFYLLLQLGNVIGGFYHSRQGISEFRRKKNLSSTNGGVLFRLAFTTYVIIFQLFNRWDWLESAFEGGNDIGLFYLAILIVWTLIWRADFLLLIQHKKRT